MSILERLKAAQEIKKLQEEVRAAQEENQA
jgi:hypothetical protein